MDVRPCSAEIETSGSPVGNFGAIAIGLVALGIGLVALGAIAWAVSHSINSAAASNGISKNEPESKIRERPPRTVAANSNRGDTKQPTELDVQTSIVKGSPEALRPRTEHQRILKNLGIRVEVTSTTPSETEPMQYVDGVQAVAPRIWLLNPK